jgi:transcriptional regulator with XRE-family HTH domain
MKAQRSRPPAAESPHVAEREEWQRWMKGLGRHTRRVREFLGVSQGELARRAGVSQGAVSRLEAGRGLNTPFLVLVKINVALGAALRLLDRASLADDVLRFLTFMEFLSAPSDRGGGSPAPVRGVPVEGLQLMQDGPIERLVRLYRGIPERQRAGFVSVVEAAAKALSV